LALRTFAPPPLNKLRINYQLCELCVNLCDFLRLKNYKVNRKGTQREKAQRFAKLGVEKKFDLHLKKGEYH